ncbi:Crp/Fnr family transcriptional regulator [Paenibacillus pasadenensis]|uniref:Putative N-ribosylNicotinamide CRP-like regulator n=1 Tax=Paenibacillus pasadenensis TaxID=217090 RepID=A0A2N5N6Q4_9BACL|nr:MULTISPECIES: Crp/Fnr family transcriptional regulator [Paenibacillus]PLT45959.1 putative N-ribosylNicotinamide CRP-like regulator [Paenibacillus pasadenensis]
MESEAETIRRHLLELGLGEAIPPELARRASLVTAEPGEAIVRQGGRSDSLLLLAAGKIKVYTTTPDGKSLILSFLGPPEMLGDIEYVQRGLELMNTVEAVTPATLIRIPYREADRLAADHAPFLRFLLGVITRKFQMKNNSLSFNLLYPVEVRLASYLLSVCGAEDGRESARLEAGALRDAANLIGTSYRHLNRVLLQFARDGLIERARSSIAVRDRDALAALAQENIYEPKSGGRSE